MSDSTFRVSEFVKDTFNGWARKRNQSIDELCRDIIAYTHGVRDIDSQRRLFAGLQRADKFATPLKLRGRRASRRKARTYNLCIQYGSATLQ